MTAHQSLSPAALTAVLQENPDLKPGQHLLVAVSGGGDSLCLTHLLWSLGAEWSFQISLAHINHCLRKTARRDQRLVEEIARRWDLPLQVVALDPATRPAGQSVEMWAREERYAALEKIRRQVQADWILTAHQGNDQVETILQHLQGGCGLEGLQGIPPRRGRVLRPLLPFNRRQIQAYLDQAAIPHLEDESNADRTLSRNFLRHEIVSRWEARVPALAPAFGDFSRHAREASQAIDYCVQQLKTTLVRTADDGQRRIELQALQDLPPFLALRLIQLLLPPTRRPWRRHRWEALKTFLTRARTGSIVTLPEGWRLLRDRSEWILAPPVPPPTQGTVRPGEQTSLGALEFDWRWVNRASLQGGDPWVEVIDGEAVQDCRFRLRSWRPGDRFQPLGMAGHKKVSDFLTDYKLDRFAKERQLVLTADGEVIWVCGLRISEAVRIGPQTTRMAELSLRKTVA